MSSISNTPDNHACTRCGHETRLTPAGHACDVCGLVDPVPFAGIAEFTGIDIGPARYKCFRCGGETQPFGSGAARMCPACGMRQRVHPCKVCGAPTWRSEFVHQCSECGHNETILCEMCHASEGARREDGPATLWVCDECWLDWQWIRAKDAPHQDIPRASWLRTPLDGWQRITPPLLHSSRGLWVRNVDLGAHLPPQERWAFQVRAGRGGDDLAWLAMVGSPLFEVIEATLYCLEMESA